MPFPPHLLKTFAAIEMFPGEMAHDTVKAFVQAAASKGLKFKVLDFLGILTLGRTKYIRFRTDLPNVLGNVPRNTIAFYDGSYTILDSTLKPLGKVPGTLLQAPKVPGLHREYRGPGAPYWERQFL